MLNLIERRKEIVRLTETNERVDVEALAKQFAVSAVTIRNDLNALSAKGLVVRSRGGAVASTRLTRELSLQEKYRKNLSVKRQLGQTVADLIDDEARSLFLDSGTTTEEVALCLLGRTNLTVTTNGLNIATALAGSDGVEVRITGGALRKKSRSFYGRQAEESLRYMHFDTLILGADGVDMRVGVTTHFEQEASLNRMMCQAARQVILVADSSKFERRNSHVICRLSEIDMLVTDNGLPSEIQRAVEAQGVRLYVVGRTT
ncbi:MAG: transcriptional repressor AgaR [Rhodospirillaceae bacterium]|nr:transcriptional repressor AgaR [Rhodospirillaceae bacterium]